jgi:DNA repair exonuclease SbcCD ATPase subunit
MILVNAIEAERFMAYGGNRVRLELPARGVVLVTGDNGAGKSSIIEAVSVGLWGRSLRGTPPWHDQVDCRVRAETPLVKATRRRSNKGKNLLTFDVPRDLPTEHDTASKAQEALERVVGPWDVWRRACVFSSGDAAHFTLATDAERKRLLETILGLERFDRALRACRDDLKSAEIAVTNGERQCDVQSERVRGERERRERARVDLSRMTPDLGYTVADCEVKLVELDEIARKAAQDARKASEGLHAVQRWVDAAAEALLRARRHADLVAGGDCPTCARPWDGGTVAAARADVEAAERRAADVQQAAEGERTRARAELEELEEERQHASEARSRWVTRHTEAKNHAAQRARLAAVLGEADDDLASQESSLGNMLAEVVALRQSAGEFAAAERVLSLTGVRSQLLAGSLAGIEAVANTWLGRIAGWGMRLELKPYAEKASGGVKDAISLAVHGAGGGHGYHAASGGQRRRIDVALMLALAEVASAAHGAAGGTLFFDEVFDALDRSGVEAVCAVLEEVAATRPVVLITHSPLLQEALSPSAVSMRVRAVTGALEVEE